MDARAPMPMSTTSVPSRRPSTSQSTPVIDGSPACPVTTVTDVDTVRCVTGIPAAAGAANAELTPGTTSTSIPARRRASASSPPRPNTNGSPPFRRTTRTAAAPVGDQQLVDPGLAVGLARTLAHVDALGRRGGQVEEFGGDEPVVDDHLGGGQELGPPSGEQAGIAGAGAHQGDTHAEGRHGPRSPPPASSNR